MNKALPYSSAIGATLLLVTSQAMAESCQIIDDESLASHSDQRISNIVINNGNLFDPKMSQERLRVHSFTNSLHIKTRKETIKAALPFEIGDLYSKATLSEGERILRNKRYIRDATIKPVIKCSNGIVVEVNTIDNWTLTPSLNFGSAGGENTYKLELQDLNFLGTGKELKLVNKRSGNSKESSFIYGDDNVFGGRYKLRLESGKNDVGNIFEIQTGLPFYSDNSPNSWWLNVKSQTDTINNSQNVGSFTTVLNEHIDIRFRKRAQNSYKTDFVIGGGLRHERQESASHLSVVDTNLANDYNETYPFFDFHWLRANWTKKNNYENFLVNEDVNFGFEFRTEVGFILKGIAENSDNKIRVDIALRKGWQLTKNAFHKIAATRIQYINDDSEKYRFSARYRYFRWISKREQLDIRLTAEKDNSYSPIYNPIVGGENGLKAYPNNYQQGNNRIIGLIEYRRITGWSPYSLANTAFSIFAESGHAWNVGDDIKLLANIGVGFLISPTRSSRAAINRFEIAIPLVQGEGVSGFQIFIGTKLNY